MKFEVEKNKTWKIRLCCFGIDLNQLIAKLWDENEIQTRLIRRSEVYVSSLAMYYLIQLEK